MKIALLLSLILLTGCSTVVPVAQKFPEPPGTLATQPCEQLQQLKEAAQLSDVSKTITHNYTKYHECSVKLEAWQDWYVQQKTIFQGLR